MRRIHIGTSGWEYPHWRGRFYPEGMPQTSRFDFYASRFDSVEVNRTFYRLAERSVFERWREAAPKGFLFAVKASRFLTHNKKLRDPEPPLRNLLERAEGLGAALGPILLQLPPRWRANAQRLEEFLRIAPAGFRYAFEFRDPTWWNDEVYAVLRAHGAAFCIFDLAGRLSPEPVTANFVYVRLHGPGGPYQGLYRDEGLVPWAARIADWRRRRKEVFVYFDNDQEAHATTDALRLREMTGA